ncbi:hypothetical protein WJX81_006295 [Elliptochloris bilobata]|uniref:Uncharacterized protein n=1 Tax=Elliptochloris bilobata TaxID=381761 RepID=A0AAW1S3L5_9CHLO
MEALERKVRAVYDALEARKNKVAIKAASAALQKHKGNQLLRALKALAQQRCGNEAEALKACAELQQEVPTDNQVLNLLALVWKATGQQKELTATYAAASAAHPKETELLRGLFAAHVAEFDFAKQQQVAMRLHRAGGPESERCLWWAVASLVLQARAEQAGSGGGGLGRDQLLQLASSLAAKQMAKAPVACQEELQLHLHILQERGQGAEALAALEGPLSATMPLAGERERLRATLTEAAGSVGKAARLWRAIWSSSPDDWIVWRAYLRCALAACESPTPENGLDTRDGGAASGASDAAALRIAAQARVLDEAKDALLAASGATHAPTHGSQHARSLPPVRLRGPALAAVDLAKRRLSLGLADQRGKCNSSLGLAESIAAYFASFGDSASYRDLRRRVSAFQIQEDLGMPVLVSAEDAEARAATLVALHARAAAAAQEEQLDPKERGAADECLAMAAGMLLAAWRLERSPRSPYRLLQALALLEAGQMARAVSAPLRLAAAALYGLLGAPEAAAAQLAALNVKNIQIDTVTGHLLLPALLAVPCGAKALAEVLAAAKSLRANHLREAGTSLLAAMQWGHYSKVLEFVKFKERLEASHTSAVAAVEARIAGLRTAGQHGLAAAREAAAGGDSVAVPERLRFNEDLSAVGVLEGAVEALAGLSGVEKDGLESWCTGAAKQAAACPLPDACEVLLLATFAVALQVTEAAAAAALDDTRKLNTLLGALAKTVAAVCKRVASLASEEALWLSLCCQAWCEQVAKARRKRGGRESGPQGGALLDKGFGEALAGVRDQAHSGLRGVLEALPPFCWEALNVPAELLVHQPPSAEADAFTSLRAALASLPLQQRRSCHKLAMLVPYRSRPGHLAEFLPEMQAFLTSERINFDIVVLEQSPRFRFNRGALLNAGVLLMSSLDHDYFVFNDADTVPAKDSGIHYAFPEGDLPLHVTPPGLHPKYSDNEVFFGGVAAFSREQIMAVNGHGTEFWGWGKEDDNLRDRLARIRSGMENDTEVFGEAATGYVANERVMYDFDTGLNTTTFCVSEVQQVERLAIKILIELECNSTATPWCVL